MRTSDIPETVIFGARPCDAKGFRIFDRVFIDGDTRTPTTGAA